MNDLLSLTDLFNRAIFRIPEVHLVYIIKFNKLHYFQHLVYQIQSFQYYHLTTECKIKEKLMIV